MTGQEAFEERFGFKARGEFRCDGWFKIPITAIGLGILLPGAILIFKAIPHKTSRLEIEKVV
ncbi:MAG: hypothetical protein J6A19_07690 [Oscillospiraceae bacterium]|nr:hypothetical protein [Oscillospiraceae bacterium]